jgi:membrane protease YdiL (CAAX protease family)
MNSDPAHRPVPRLRDDIVDVWRLLRRPSLHRLRPRHRGCGQRADWQPVVGLRRLMAWVALLWIINLFALGPVAVEAARLGGAEHRLDMGAIPWFTAIFWAPLLEEMLFRYGLRRPVQALWVVPLLLWPLLHGPGIYTLPMLFLAIALAVYSQRPSVARQGGWQWAWRRRYVRHFPAVFYLASLVFAGMHLGNFVLNKTPLWLMPLLVLPQWLTGLVLSWTRVRRGIGASMLMHGLFNAGPVLLVLAILKWAPMLAG